MTEEQHIIRARAEEDCWEAIEQLVEAWDSLDEGYGEPDLDYDIDAIITALGY